MSQRLKELSKTNVTFVTIAELRDYLRIPSTSANEDPMLKDLIEAAIESVERLAWITIYPRSYQLNLTKFCDKLKLPKPPFIELTSIGYLESDTSGSYTTLDSSSYYIDDTGDFATISYINPLPIHANRTDAIKIVYEAGYETASLLPKALKMGIILMAGHLYDNRGIVSNLQANSVPKTLELFFEPFRKNHFDI